MRVLVTFAVDAEFAPWRKRRAFRLKQMGALEVSCANIGELELNVALTGIGGKSRAWIGASFDCDIDICISSGLAGALRAQYAPGDILVPNYVGDFTGRKTVCDAELRKLAVEAGAHEVDCFYSTDSVILLSVEKRTLGTNADAVDMETAEVLVRMAAHGARVVAIRGISDAVDEDLPLDFNRVTTDTGELSMGRILGQVAKNPAKVPSLIRFGRQSRRAAEELCGFLDRYVEGLSKALPAMTREAAR